MLGTLIIKEIRENFLNSRFHFSALVCLVLIPFGMYAAMKHYEQNLNAYNQTMQIYERKSEGKIGYNFQAEGYRPPSAKGIFAAGLEDHMPNKVKTARGGNFNISNEQGMDNPYLLLFGRLDFLFISEFILSLLALIITFSSISGEKEKGTLRLLVASRISRAQLYMAKLTGNFIVFFIPLFIAFLVGLFLLSFSDLLNPFEGDFFLTATAVFCLALLFVFSMLNIGMLISSLTHSVITSMAAALFIWVVLALVVPKLSPMLAEIICPVKSKQVIEIEKEYLRIDIENEKLDKVDVIWKELHNEYDLDPQAVYSHPNTEKLKNVYSEFEGRLAPVEEDYSQRLGTAIENLNRDYFNRKKIQSAIAMNLSRISPVSCFTYVISEISGNGLLEAQNFLNNADRFQTDVEQALYGKIEIKRFGGKSSYATSPRFKDGFGWQDLKNLEVPHMISYQHISLGRALESELIDIVLLAFFNILFLSAGLAVFNRYDVR